jgi:hypothetical protein
MTGGRSYTQHTFKKWIGLKGKYGKIYSGNHGVYEFNPPKKKGSL